MGVGGGPAATVVVVVVVVVVVDVVVAAVMVEVDVPAGARVEDGMGEDVGSTVADTVLVAC
ncbi:MAG: hypothetical protein CL466_12935 [Acidimicrobiaceae bacterium]|nr:hypothetical protein [Acidimicrobiaceae bacterium]|tara:strand:+ start:850 stop:1032 length:183 start_codon:yes stop_codon:yes gene_type:complete